ncbi:HAD family hydrolase [Pilosibacter fragilis]|jgi:Cof subfamily protein (haloacid dehalogenase superfamily)|uniref:HAD family hydrolase n=1 Tax=Pilosibacter fragilis TaxID=3078042 RepID=UPI0031BAEA3C
MKRKALFFDIDGTLLVDASKELPKSAALALTEARRAGHLVFINSGRTRCLMKDVEGKVPVDGYLCGCGTYIEAEGKALLHRKISAKRRWELQKAILECKLDGILEGPKACTVQTGVSHMDEIEHVKNVVYKNQGLASADWNTELVDFDKFCVLADENSDEEGFLKILAPDVTAIDRGHGLYECVPTGYDKATAMEVILKRYGIAREDSYAFGDSMNDLAMIRYAGNSIIMENHAKGLEPYATFITKDVEDDGIAWAFEQLHII